MKLEKTNQNQGCKKRVILGQMQSHSQNHKITEITEITKSQTFESQSRENHAVIDKKADFQSQCDFRVIGEFPVTITQKSRKNHKITKITFYFFN